jgi:hypothetical protein
LAALFAPLLLFFAGTHALGHATPFAVISPHSKREGLATQSAWDKLLMIGQPAHMIAGSKTILLRWEEPRAFVKALGRTTPLPTKWIPKIGAFVLIGGLLIVVRLVGGRSPINWTHMVYGLAGLAVVVAIDPFSWLTWQIIVTEKGIERTNGKSLRQWRYSDIAAWSVQELTAGPQRLRVFFLRLRSGGLYSLAVTDDISVESLRAIFESNGVACDTTKSA